MQILHPVFRELWQTCGREVREIVAGGSKGRTMRTLLRKRPWKSGGM